MATPPFCRFCHTDSLRRLFVTAFMIFWQMMPLITDHTNRLLVPCYWRLNHPLTYQISATMGKTVSRGDQLAYNKYVENINDRLDTILETALETIIGWFI